MSDNAHNTTSEYKTILVAVECSKESEEVLKKAKRLADSQGGAEVKILHVVIDIIAVDWVGMPGQLPPPIDQEELSESAANYLKPMIEAAGLDPATMTMRYGFAAQEILDEAKETNADLIIAGSHARHGLERLLGSTAHKILNLSECDVLLVRV
jgi:universal stress protein A